MVRDRQVCSVALWTGPSSASQVANTRCTSRPPGAAAGAAAEASVKFTVSEVFWAFLMLSMLQPWLRQRMLEAGRLRLLRRIERQRGSRLILMSHRQETMAFLGFPMPKEFIELMRFFPQPAQHQPTVQYIPVPYGPPPGPRAEG